MKTHTLALTQRLAHPQATEALGKQFAAHSPRSMVVFLKGPLGAGKTTFVRGFIQALDSAQRVKSPTYTLVESYETRRGLIFHFDLYRLEHPNELEYIGIRDYTKQPAIWLVEWPEKVIANNKITVLPPVDVTISFKITPEDHEITLTSNGLRGYQVLKDLKNAQHKN